MNIRLILLNALCLLGAISVLADENLPALKAGSEVYRNVTVTTITATDVYFTYNNGAGMANVKLKNLDPDLQKHFHYNPAKADAVEQKQAKANAEYHSQIMSQPAAQPPDESRDASAAGKTVLESLPIGSPFPDFDETDLGGEPISVAGFKGKVVLVDFWATWCGPCRGELPNVIATYQKHHADGFEIIGVSLDSDRNTLNTFLKQTDGMTWQQYFDGQGWSNKLAVKYGVESIPFAVLVGPDGKIIGKSLRGEELEDAVAHALAQK
jgi:thiol-disulfide isomerase/thioredoxin